MSLYNWDLCLFSMINSCLFFASLFLSYQVISMSSDNRICFRHFQPWKCFEVTSVDCLLSTLLCTLPLYLLISEGLRSSDTTFYATPSSETHVTLNSCIRPPSQVPFDVRTDLSQFYLLNHPCCLYITLSYSNSLCGISYAPMPT